MVASSLEDIKKVVEEGRKTVARLESELSEARQGLAENETKLREAFMAEAQQFGLNLALEKGHVPEMVVSPPEKKKRKERAERWKIQRFLKFIHEKHPPQNEMMGRITPNDLDISMATVYKYTFTDEKGKVQLRKEGMEALEH